MDDVTRAPLARPPGRYGEDRPSWHRVLARVLTAALAAAGVGFVVWLALSGEDDVTWADVGFHLEGDDLAPGEVSADFVVWMDPGASATCEVRALNDRFAVVGSADVVVEPSSAGGQRVTGVVRVSEPAVSVGVDRCELR